MRYFTVLKSNGSAEIMTESTLSAHVKSETKSGACALIQFINTFDAKSLSTPPTDPAEKS